MEQIKKQKEKAGGKKKDKSEGSEGKKEKKSKKKLEEPEESASAVPDTEKVIDEAPATTAVGPEAKLKLEPEIKAKDVEVEQEEITKEPLGAQAVEPLQGEEQNAELKEDQRYSQRPEQ